MRQYIGGDGTDTSAAVQAARAAGNRFWQANLILIGDPEDPKSIYLTDYDCDLTWSVYDRPFRRATVSRGSVTSKIGLEVATMPLTWSPKTPRVFTQSIATANPIQLAQMGFYDNYVVRVWRCLMPTPGDANTFGACQLFGGRIAETSVDRSEIRWTVNSFLDVVNQMYPANVIEATSTMANWTGATPPPGMSVVPRFNVISGSSSSVLLGQATSPSPGYIFNNGVLARGYVVFLSGAGATLPGQWSAIQNNGKVSIGIDDFNQIVLYRQLPWVPTPGVDRFFVSLAAPPTAQLGAPDTFPYIPNPVEAI